MISPELHTLSLLHITQLLVSKLPYTFGAVGNIVGEQIMKLWIKANTF